MNINKYLPAVIFFDKTFTPFDSSDLCEEYESFEFALVLPDHEPEDLAALCLALDDAGYVYDGLQDAKPGWYRWQIDENHPCRFWRWMPYPITSADKK